MMKQQANPPVCQDIFRAETEAAAGECFARLWLTLAAQTGQPLSPADSGGAGPGAAPLPPSLETGQP